ncbi:hypothetical protein GOBAR_AA06830 [Gossypium barbadense]|uniref:Chromatin assembly factor 1 subunit FAS1 n=1 Tax=Gossypium barbadense TaxID=3634 RepID=A0A2P5YDU6_GOSBA|nr:hypothetical protein GOBAR_AA06830 [Gossypium barbadense]
MADSVPVIGVDDDPKSPKMVGNDQPKEIQKRKRASWVWEALSDEQREAQIKRLKQEMDGLFGYYKEVLEQKSGLGMELLESGCSLNSLVAVLMEESDLPLLRLIETIHEQVKDRMGNVSMAAVKSAVLFVGQRVKYGLGNEDADVLEDDSQSSLWCWETRDLKLMPKSARAELRTRRTCRNKISERITAVSGYLLYLWLISAMITLLEKWEDNQKYKHGFVKASEKLFKVLNEADIRFLMRNMSQQSGAEIKSFICCRRDAKEAKREEKLLIKQLERNKREMEQEKKKLNRELQKEKLQNEKEKKRLLEEAEKFHRRREREEAEMRKQLRKQQEEAERDHLRREKEEAELKKKLSIQKQASVMERFVKKCKTSPTQMEELTKRFTLCASTQKIEKLPEPITLSMDNALSSNEEINADYLRKLHLSSWRHLGHSLRSNQKQCWGMRKKPKTDLFKELKLTANKRLSQDELSVERLVDVWGEQNSDVNKSCVRKQLLQFDASYKPAFYGIWPKKRKSNVVRPRCPWRKDPDLDYDVDSDEEWEELLKLKNTVQSVCSKTRDSFEACMQGVQVDRMEIDVHVVETQSSHINEQVTQNEEFGALLRQQNYLNNLTEHALRKNQPLIILNLLHEKASLLMAEDLNGNPKLEQACLQALSMLACPGAPSVEISLDSMVYDNQEACLSGGKAVATPVSSVESIPDSDLPLIVSTIQSCSHGINRLVESLQLKFPSIPKTQLRNKVREISDFVDNRWQVKKEILVKLGMSISPGNSGGRTKTIAAFFTKRCLPPNKGIGDRSNPIETSPQQLTKPGCDGQGQEQTSCTYNHHTS